jgi:hypothetical protein
VATIILGAHTCFADDELELYAAEQKRLINDATRPESERARIAINLAGALDRAAQAAPSVDQRRRRWAQAVAVLDDFNGKNPKHAESDPFALQAGVYRWAEGQSWLEQALLEPADNIARQNAAKALDDAIHRLTPVAERNRLTATSLAVNARYRLAQALADHARLAGTSATGAQSDWEKALGWLSPGIDDPMLKGRAAILRAEILNGLDRFTDALAAVSLAEKAKPSPAEIELLTARVDSLIGLKKADDAWEAVEASKVDDNVKSTLAIRVRLAQRAERGPGKLRLEIERDLFGRANALRKANSPEGRVELRRLARAIAEPDPALGPEAWDTLADGQLALGSPAEAARLVLTGAKRADAIDRHEIAAQLRFRAGAIQFQAGNYRQADELLSAIVDDQQAGGIRPRAGLLRSLARARGVAASLGGFSQPRYLSALEAQIREFPHDASAHEAQWLLGLARLAAGDRQAAEALWKAIPRDQPRGLDARLALFKLIEDDIESQRLAISPADSLKLMNHTRAQLIKLRDESANLSDRAEIDLARASLELIPGLGQPSDARKACEAALSRPHRPDLERRARLLQIVTLVEEQRYLEAESLAKAHVSTFSTSEVLSLASRLDRLACATGDSDADQRRIGQLLQHVLAPVLTGLGRLAPQDQLETRLRQARASFFFGDPATARSMLSAFSPERFATDLKLLRELADLQERLGLDTESVATYKLLASRLTPGALAWFEARLGEASALARTRDRRAARRLIEATSLLHPELGGPVMKARFEKLRTSLDAG